jgi:hypothetical protein
MLTSPRAYFNFGQGSSPFSLRDLSTVGCTYSGNIQMDDCSINPTSTSLNNFNLLTYYPELGELDDSFFGFKQLPYVFYKTITPSLLFITTFFGS